MIKYKIFYGGWTGERIVGDKLTKIEADTLYKELSGGDIYMCPRIEKYDVFDIKEDRKLKLQRLKNV